MHIGIFELFFQLGNLALLLGHNDQFRINILGWDVRNLRGLTSVIERAQVLFEVAVGRGQAGDHECVRVATQTLLQ